MEDIFRVILSNIDRGSTFKAARLVCRIWRDITQKLFPDGHLVFANHLQTIVEKVIEHNKGLDNMMDLIRLDFNELSCNPGITLDFIKRHKELPWDMANFCRGPNMPDEYVDAYLKKYGNYCAIISKHLSWKSMVEIGLWFIESSIIPVITPEMALDVFTKDPSVVTTPPYDILAEYGNEEVIVQYNLYNNQKIATNNNLSLEFVLAKCPPAQENYIRREFIRLHREGRLTYKLLDSSNARNYLDIECDGIKYQSQLHCLSCETHEYLGEYCVQCAPISLLEKWTIDIDRLLSYENKYIKELMNKLTVREMYIDESGDKTTIRLPLRLIQLIKNKLTSLNEEILDETIEDAMHKQEWYKSSWSKLTWVDVTEDLYADWIDWGKICENSFKYPRFRFELSNFNLQPRNYPP